MRRTVTAAITTLALGLGATAAAADRATGTWLTGADKKGQVAHVDVYTCGQALCGKIVRAYDSQGNQITTKNVGKRVFWDMTPEGDNTYEGRAFVPAHNRNYDAKIRVSGGQMKVKGCLGPVCQSQTWSRVK